MKIEHQDEELQKDLAKQIYNTLSNYLILLTELRNNALETKKQLEEILGINDIENL